MFNINNAADEHKTKTKESGSTQYTKELDRETAFGAFANNLETSTSIDRQVSNQFRDKTFT